MSAAFRLDNPKYPFQSWKLGKDPCKKIFCLKSFSLQSGFWFPSIAWWLALRGVVCRQGWLVPPGSTALSFMYNVTIRQKLSFLVAERFQPASASFWLSCSHQLWVWTGKWGSPSVGLVGWRKMLLLIGAPIYRCGPEALTEAAVLHCC